MSNWPHSPSHEVNHPGSYIITAATYKKQKRFNTPEKLSRLQEHLLGCLDTLGWRVQAWAVFPNHYHFVGQSPESGLNLDEMTRMIHRGSATLLNEIDDQPGRMVWYRCWDTHISNSKSYMARLAYVHNNPVRHGFVAVPEMYEWCSAQWFKAHASGAFYESILRFKTDRVNVYDDFE